MKCQVIVHYRGGFALSIKKKKKKNCILRIDFFSRLGENITEKVSGEAREDVFAERGRWRKYVRVRRPLVRRQYHRNEGFCQRMLQKRLRIRSIFLLNS